VIEWLDQRITGLQKTKGYSLKAILVVNKQGFIADFRALLEISYSCCRFQGFAVNFRVYCGFQNIAVDLSR